MPSEKQAFTGHWIQHCPTLSDPNFQTAKRYRAPVGIPKPALVEDPEGDYILDGKIYKLATSMYVSFSQRLCAEVEIYHKDLFCVISHRPMKQS